MMWVGDYRQKAPAAACDLKKGRKVPVGGSPAWRLPKIERDRDQSRRSQAAPPRRSEGLLPPRLDRSPPLQEGTRQWEGSRRQLNLTYAPPSKDARCCPSQVNRTRPGECRECCGFRALEMDAGRVWKPLTTARSGSAEKLQARDKEVLLQAQDRDQAQAQTRRFVVPGLGKSPVVDGGRVGRCWQCLRGRTGRCRCQCRRTQRRMRQSRASDKVCLSIRSSPVRFLLSSQICWLRYVENVECATLQQAMYVGMQCLAGQVRARMGKYARMERRCAGNGRQTGRCQVVGYILETVSRDVCLIKVPLGGPAGRERERLRETESKLDLMESFDGFA